MVISKQLTLPFVRFLQFQIFTNFSQIFLFSQFYQNPIENRCFKNKKSARSRQLPAPRVSDSSSIYFISLWIYLQKDKKRKTVEESEVKKSSKKKRFFSSSFFCYSKLFIFSSPTIEASPQPPPQTQYLSENTGPSESWNTTEPPTKISKQTESLSNDASVPIFIFSLIKNLLLQITYKILFWRINHKTKFL